MQEPQQRTVHDIVQATLNANRDAYDQNLTEEQRRQARADALSLIQATRHWQADVELGPLWSDMLHSVDFTEKQRDPTRLDRLEAEIERRRAQTAYGGVSGRQLMLPMNDTERQGVIASLDRDTAHNLGVRPLYGADLSDQEGGVSTDPTLIGLTEELGNRPALLKDTKAWEQYEMWTNPILRDDLDNPYIQLSSGEQRYIRDFRKGGRIPITDEKGDVTDWITLTPDIMESVRLSNVGGAIRDTVVEAIADRVWPERKADTPFGPMLVPKITGNPTLDQHLMERPEWARGVQMAQPTQWERFSSTIKQQLLGGVEFVGVMVATEGAGRMLGAGAEALAGTKAVQALARTDAGVSGLAARSFKGMVEAAAEGRRLPSVRKLAPHGLRYDMRQIGEEVWYETVKGLARGDWKPDQWVASGLGEGVSEYFLGSAARGLRYGFGSMVRSKKFNRMVAALSGETKADATTAWITRYDKPDQFAIRRGAQRLRDSKVGLQTRLAKELALETAEESSHLLNRSKILGQVFDTTFVATGFGAYQGAISASARDGKNWTSLSLEEKGRYLVDSIGSAETLGTIGGMMGLQAMWLGGTRVRGGPTAFSTLDDQTAVHLAQTSLLEAKHAMQDANVAKSMVAMLDGAVTPQEQEAVVKQRLGMGASDIDPIPDQTAEHIIRLYWSTNGDNKISSAIRGLPEEDLRFLEGKLRGLWIDDMDGDDAGAVGHMLEWIDREWLRRDDGGQLEVFDPLTAELDPLTEEELETKPRVARQKMENLTDAEVSQYFLHKINTVAPKGKERATFDVYHIKRKGELKPTRNLKIRQNVLEGRTVLQIVEGSKLKPVEDLIFEHTERGLADAQRTVLEMSGMLEPGPTSFLAELPSVLQPKEAKAKRAQPARKVTRLEQLVAQAQEEAGRMFRRAVTEQIPGGLDLVNAIIEQRATEQRMRAEAQQDAVRRQRGEELDSSKPPTPPEVVKAEGIRKATAQWIKRGNRMGRGWLEEVRRKTVNPDTQAAIDAALSKLPEARAPETKKQRRKRVQQEVSELVPTPEPVEDRAPTAEEMGEAITRIYEALKEMPGVGEGDAESVAASWLGEQDTLSVSELEAATLAAEEAGAQLSDQQPDVKMMDREGKVPGSRREQLPYVTMDEVSGYWGKPDSPEFEAFKRGAVLFAPGRGGRNLRVSREGKLSESEGNRQWRALRNLMETAITDRALILSENQEVAAAAAARLDATIAGMLMGSGAGFGSKNKVVVTQLVTAISGLGTEHVDNIQKRLLGAGAQYDGRIRDVLASLRTPSGKPLFGGEWGKQGQLGRQDLQDLLRLAVLGSPVDGRQARGGVLAGRYAKNLDAWWWQQGRAVITNMVATTGEFEPARAAQATDILYKTMLQDVLRAMPEGKRINIQDTTSALLSRIGYNLIGRHNLPPNTVVEGLTLGDYTNLLLQRLTEGVYEPVAGVSDAVVGGITTPVAPAPAPKVSGEPIVPLRAGRTYEHMARKTQDLWFALGETGLVPVLDDTGLPDFTDPEVGRQVTLMTKLLVEENEALTAQLTEAGYNEDLVDELRTKANEVSAYMQKLVTSHMAEQFETSGVASGQEALDTAAQLVDDISSAIAAEARGEAMDVEVAKRLKAVNPLFVEEKATVGLRLAQGVEHDMMKGAQSALTGMLRTLAAEAKSEAEEITGTRAAEVSERGDILGALAEKVESDGRVQFLAGINRESMVLLTSLFNWSTGFYDRALNYPHAANYEFLSARGLLTPNAVFDSFAKRDQWWSSTAGRRIFRSVIQGATQKTGFLTWWQRYVGRGVRGLGSESVRTANLRLHRALNVGRNVHNEVASHVSRLGKMFEDMHLSEFEANIIGKSIDLNMVDRVHNREEFEKVWGTGTGHLFDTMLLVNDAFVEMGHSMYDAGLISREQLKLWESRYIPAKFMQWALDPANPSFSFDQPTDNRWKASSQEFPRGSQVSTNDAVRTYDVRYLLPLAAAKASMRLRLFHALGAMVDNGAILSREEYDKLTPFEQSQFIRASVRPDLGVSVYRETADSPRRPIRVEQAQMAALIESERRLRSRDDGPPMTDKMEALLSKVEDGYVTHNSSLELSILLDQSELTADNPGRSRLGDFVNQATLEWRRLKTIQNPKHWVLQAVTNWFTNAATGKVPLGDMVSSILMGKGSYHDAATHLVEWHDWEDRGANPFEVTKNIEEVREFVKVMGGGTFVNTTMSPVNAHDILMGFMEGTGGQPLEAAEGTEAYRALSLFTQAYSRAGRGYGVFDGKWAQLAGSPNPEARAEAKRALLGLYNLNELFWKYAAYREGRKLGMSVHDASEWAAEGSGDWADRNPFIYKMTTNFSASIGGLQVAARKALGKTAKPPLISQAFRMGMGSPFWMYRWSMWPTLGKSMVNHPHKVLAAYALMHAVFRAISSNGLDDLYEDLAGRDQFLHGSMDPESMEVLGRKYADSPVNLFPGNMGRIKVSEYVQIHKAYLENLVNRATLGLVGRRRPEGGLVSLAKGPTFGGESTYLDLSEFTQGPDTINDFFNYVSDWNDWKPISTLGNGADELGVGFLPTIMATATVRGMQLVSGVKGKSKAQVWAEAAADLTSELSAPMGGGIGSSLLSREARFAISTFALEGRDLDDLWNNYPSSRLPLTFGEKVGLTSLRTLTPLRRVPTTSVEPVPRTLSSRAAKFFGADTRPAPSKDPELVKAEERGYAARNAVKNLVRRAYKENLKTGLPLGTIHNRMFDLSKDALVDDAGSFLDIRDDPLTDLGRFIRSSSGTPEGRRQTYAAVKATIDETREQLTQLLSGPHGVVHARSISPEHHDRLVGAIFRGAEDADATMKFLVRQMTDPKTRRAGAKDYDGVWFQLWEDLDMGSYGSKLPPGKPNHSIWVRGQNWYAKRQADSLEAQRLDARLLRQAVGPQIRDVLPTYDVSTQPQRTNEPLFPALFGGN